MQKMYTPIRIGLLFVFLSIMVTIYVSALYYRQIFEPMSVDEDAVARNFITRTTAIHAARGNIYDRNGVLLASGRPSYNIKIDRVALRAFPNPNEIVQELVYAAMDEGITYTDTFPVTRGAPFEFVTNMSDVQRNRLDIYFDYHNLDPDMSVSELLAWMRNHYRINYTIGILDARLIIGVRYELEIRAIIHTINPYIFASDVDTDFIAYIEERGLGGVFAESTFIREYHTIHAAHMLGYVGAMTADEFERYRHDGYPMDAVVGKIGAELAFEHELHGASGERTMRLREDGTVMEIEVTREPRPGNHITLTMDLDLQIAVEHALRTQIDIINLERERERAANEQIDPEAEEEDDRIPAGAAVVVDVNTGEILAAASFPTFNLQTLHQDWASLNTDTNFPMYNRATQGRYPPGSTFKMVTLLAGLRHIDDLSMYFPINCTGVFDKYSELQFTAHCWIFRDTFGGHGELHSIQALECSCNYYFMRLADWLPGGALAGAELIAEAARDFGLGINTGIELPEFAGILATPEEKARLLPNERFYIADTLMAGFGQGFNRFTPLQLANYAATIANGGTLNALSFLRSVRNPDFEILSMHEPEVISLIEETEYIEIIQEGMVAASRGSRGTARTVFGSGEYPIVVASKTGTVQVEGRTTNDGVFVCYAPAHDPQIAIAVVVEKGGSGAAIMYIARDILNHYFMTNEAFLTVTPYGELRP